MTHKASELKQVIEAEAKKRFPVTDTSIFSGLMQDGFTAGCNFMAGHLEKEFDELRAKIAGDAFEAGWTLGDREAQFNYTDNVSREYLNQAQTKEQYLASLTDDDGLNISDYQAMNEKLQDRIRELKEEIDKLKSANQDILNAHYRNHPEME